MEKNIELVKKNGISYIYTGGKKKRYKPWLGDVFSFLYDYSMEKSIFPRKFDASIEEHMEFLQKEYFNIRNNDVLELATGTGNVSEVLPSGNKYTGIDISEGLLKRAYENLKGAGFDDPRLVVCSADELPFQSDSFDICICNLSLNFFPDIERVLSEMKRVLRSGGEMMCSVPIPERNKKQSTIRGTLYSEEQLKEIFEGKGFDFSTYEFTNGALLYFKASLE